MPGIIRNGSLWDQYGEESYNSTARAGWNEDHRGIIPRDNTLWMTSASQALELDSRIYRLVPPRYTGST